jgi:hypothetical protein
MSNYVQSTNFATKDALSSGDPLKIVKGTEINTEFNNIATAVATKADLNSPTLVTPALGTPSSGNLANTVGLPIVAGTTGTLSVARGGTGVTTSTGTGNVVLSSSPTLVAPVLGTPASGTLTNATGLPIDAGTTGTMPVGRGGTGVTSSTGSGSVVLSASPTFTGTPSLPTGTVAVTQGSGNNTTAIATTAFVQAVKESLHPVGSIYINATNSTNPGTLLGFGTWVAFGAGRVPVGFNASDPLFDTAEETGGSKDSTLPSHTHTGTTASAGDHAHRVGISMSSLGAATAQFSSYSDQASGATRYLGGPGTESGSGFNSGVNTQTVGAHDHTFTTASAGSSGTNANLQPYITVYMFKRTA